MKKEIYDSIGKTEGDSVHIIVEKDENLPEIIVPEYLQWLLENEPETLKSFEKLTWSTKKFWIDYMNQPKNEDSKVERINHFLSVLMRKH